MKRVLPTPNFAELVQDFFCDRLLNQQNVSPHTVASYRDAFRLLLNFLHRRHGTPPFKLRLEHLDAPIVLAFLDELETERGNSIRTRNARLMAIRAFIAYASARDPTALPLAQRVLAIPQKRFNRPLLGYLSRDEVEAILDGPDRNSWSGRRDRALFAVMYYTGIRVSEAIGLKRGDLDMGPTASVHVCGKGRKERRVPLWKATATMLNSWLKELNVDEDSPLFPSRHGVPLSRSGVEDRLKRIVVIAAKRCLSLNVKNISPHTIRHTTAMHLLQSGVDMTVIALWLGHESTETTHLYVEADLQMKQKALDRIDEPALKKGRRQSSDQLLDFLEKL
jgi:site-specific recombinase XerD